MSFQVMTKLNRTGTAKVYYARPAGSLNWSRVPYRRFIALVSGGAQQMGEPR